MGSIHSFPPTDSQPLHAESVHAQAGGGAGSSPASAADQELRPDAPPRPSTAELGGLSTGEPATSPADPTKARKPRGFAAIDRKLLSEIARKGGKAAHSAGTAHEFTSDEARAAGRKGGLASHAKRKPKA